MKRVKYMDYHPLQRQDNPIRATDTLARPNQYSGISVWPPYTGFHRNEPGLSGGAPTAVAQRQGGSSVKSLQPNGPDQIPAGGKTVNTLGVVAPEVYLRPEPGTDNKPLKLLPLNARVQIIKDMGGGWYYISTEHGDTGYVAGRFVRRGVPEPGAIMHQVASGESAIGIAEKYFKEDASQWGRDLRFYVNSLVYVNYGEGDSTKGIYREAGNANWAATQVKSGYYIWIPSRAFARSLKGMVDSGSLSYGLKEGFDNTVNFIGRKLDDFNYANQFVARLLPGKLSDDILESIKSALLNFAIGMVAAGLILAVASGLGAAIGALAGFLAGGAGAVPGAALGAKIGFEIGLFLLKWIGLGLLVAQGAKLLGGIGIAFGKYVISVWEADGDCAKLEKSADLCAEAIKEFLLGVLELVVMLVAALGVGRAMGALAKSKFGKAMGTEKLQVWVNNRAKYETTRSVLGSATPKYSFNMIENPGPLAAIDPNAAATFGGGRYNVIELRTDLILYRGGKAGGGKNAFGQYFTRTAPQSRVVVRIDSAVKAQWIDPQTGALTGSSPIESVYAIKIPKGTIIYEGPAGYQSGIFVGGKEQIFISKPWEIPGVEVISETPLP
jgi:hypothetical protein